MQNNIILKWKCVHSDYHVAHNDNFQGNSTQYMKIFETFLTEGELEKCVTGQVQTIV